MSDFLGQTIRILSLWRRGREGQEKWEGCCCHSSIKEEGLPVICEWGFFFFSFFGTRIDIARIFNSFFFERQQCFIWKLETIWGLWETLFFLSEPSCPYGIQRVQQRSQWHQVTGGTKSPRIHLPDSEQHQEPLSVSLSPLSAAAPLLLLVNMHAPDILQHQACSGFCLGVVSCTVLCNNRVTKLPQHRGRILRARSHTNAFIFILLVRV